MATSLWVRSTENVFGQDVPCVFDELTTPSNRRRARTHIRFSMRALESVLTFTIVALLFVYLGATLGSRLLRNGEPPVVTVTVQKGDTLWTLSEKYGHPDDYILKRVDKLARLNEIQVGESLRVGDVIQVPVENPDVIAEMSRTAHR